MKTSWALAGVIAGLLAHAPLSAQTPDQVLVVENQKSPLSREIAQYYLRRRFVPFNNLCVIDATTEERIERPVYEKDIQAPIATFLKRRKLEEKIIYIVLTSGVPLRIIPGDSSSKSPAASVDSELSLLYVRLKGAVTPVEGPLRNPFFAHRDTPFRHPQFPIYLVTRLDGYSVADVRRMVDDALVARNTGKVVIDLRANDTTEGNRWLRTAALLVPKGRVVMDDSPKVLANLNNVIAYASWGSNDPARKSRTLQMRWLPGSIATEFVSTDARTFRPPPETWEIAPWGETDKWFAGSPQSLTADYIHEGASGASGQVDEPFLSFCPRPDYVLPAYLSGRTLAESFYMGIPALSWMNVVIGDPLMRLR